MSEAVDKKVIEYPVWDLLVRIFHWVNVLAVIGLIGVGIVILNYKVLGVSGDGKVLLKTVHVYIGYVFVTNLVIRLVWPFIGGPYARWRAILPGGKGFVGAAKGYICGLKKERHPPI